MFLNSISTIIQPQVNLFGIAALGQSKCCEINCKKLNIQTLPSSLPFLWSWSWNLRPLFTLLGLFLNSIHAMNCRCTSINDLLDLYLFSKTFLQAYLCLYFDMSCLNFDQIYLSCTRHSMEDKETKLPRGVRGVRFWPSSFSYSLVMIFIFEFIYYFSFSAEQLKIQRIYIGRINWFE